MPRTLGVTDPLPGQPPDLDGTVVDGFESAAPAVHTGAVLQACRQWFLATNRGIPQEEIEGHQTTSGIATARLTQALRGRGRGGDPGADRRARRDPAAAALRLLREDLDDLRARHGSARGRSACDQLAAGGDAEVRVAGVRGRQLRQRGGGDRAGARHPVAWEGTAAEGGATATLLLVTDERQGYPARAVVASDTHGAHRHDWHRYSTVRPTSLCSSTTTAPLIAPIASWIGWRARKG